MEKAGRMFLAYQPHRLIEVFAVLLLPLLASSQIPTGWTERNANKSRQ